MLTAFVAGAGTTRWHAIRPSAFSTFGRRVKQRFYCTPHTVVRLSRAIVLPGTG